MGVDKVHLQKVDVIGDDNGRPLLRHSLELTRFNLADDAKDDADEPRYDEMDRLHGPQYI